MTCFSAVLFLEGFLVCSRAFCYAFSPPIEPSFTLSAPLFGSRRKSSFVPLYDESTLLVRCRDRVCSGTGLGIRRLPWFSSFLALSFVLFVCYENPDLMNHVL